MGSCDLCDRAESAPKRSDSMKVRANPNEIDMLGVYTHVVMMQSPSNINGDIGGNTQPGGDRAFRPGRSTSMEWRTVIESATVFSAVARRVCNRPARRRHRLVDDRGAHLLHRPRGRLRPAAGAPSGRRAPRHGDHPQPRLTVRRRRRRPAHGRLVTCASITTWRTPERRDAQPSRSASLVKVRIGYGLGVRSNLNDGGLARRRRRARATRLRQPLVLGADRRASPGPGRGDGLRRRAHHQAEVRHERARAARAQPGRARQGAGHASTACPVGGSCPPSASASPIRRAAGVRRATRRTGGLVRRGAAVDPARAGPRTPVDHDGARFHYEGVRVQPKPVQQPPDVWLGGHRPVGAAPGGSARPTAGCRRSCCPTTWPAAAR